ncbi:hypothetical protein TRFO_31609 [Tritrichomonas foetus]|uniref:Uncharacterized protein n=1 Tax=Tritrichomonas foetus TaxID=1144522 RepID=A0A1J4JQR9_9EUKA|nr:hypothetical protein TRFO_31609 [Tritrichomonas foetus]|eukprot:OHT01519.1 hypothetical protein TRFO_31609 [Tritrichomonas foetus]
MLLENPNIDLSILTAKSQTVLHLICGFHNELDELENTTTSNIPKKSIAEKEEEVLDIVKLLVNHINIDINSTDVFY